MLGQKISLPSDIDTVLFHLSPQEKHVFVKGISLGMTIHPWSTWLDTCFVKLNGLNIELGPLGIIGGMWGTAFGLIGVKDENGKKTSFFSNSGYPDSVFHVKYGTYVNGISLSVGGLIETFNNGLIMNGISCVSYKTKGLLISGLLNSTYEFKGVNIAGLGNMSHKGYGVQIGLINNCKTGQVLQFGLFNRIGNRVIPFINFRLQKE
ncbi:MAG: hypothetical protein ABIO44_07680 [Saprospiraceae bacterium]